MTLTIRTDNAVAPSDAPKAAVVYAATAVGRERLPWPDCERASASEHSECRPVRGEPRSEMWRKTGGELTADYRSTASRWRPPEGQRHHRCRLKLLITTRTRQRVPDFSRQGAIAFLRAHLYSAKQCRRHSNDDSLHSIPRLMAVRSRRSAIRLRLAYRCREAVIKSTLVVGPHANSNTVDKAVVVLRAARQARLLSSVFLFCGALWISQPRLFCRCMPHAPPSASAPCASLNRSAVCGRTDTIRSQLRYVHNKAMHC